jgi:glycosyltransferase involved in cell wall biosynthesis
MKAAKKLLIIVFSNLQHDARVRRQIDFLRDRYALTVLCFEADEMAGVTVIRLRQTPLTFLRKAVSGILLLCRFYGSGHRILYDYSHVKSVLKDEQFDLTIANDVETLPLAFELSDNRLVIFDAHEYAPLHFEDRLWWRIFFKGLNNYLCMKYIPRVKRMITIGAGLASAYEKQFGIRPLVITNATRYHELSPSVVVDNKIRLVHHGIANPSRKIELLIELMTYLDDRFTLDLILMKSDFASPATKRYIVELGKEASRDNRIKILPQLKSSEVVNFINRYDIGVFLLPPVNFNYANTLPNKLFEYIQARLGIAVGPTPEMAAIVHKCGNGVVSGEFTPFSLAQKLGALTADELRGFKEKSAVAARDLSAENNKLIFLGMIEEILSE